MPKITWTDRSNNTTPTGAATEAAAEQFNTVKNAINSPAESLGTFNPAAIVFDKIGYYSDYNATSNISLTISGTAYDGVYMWVKILFDGAVTLSVPSGGVILNNTFTNGAVVTAGTYYLFMFYQNSVPMYSLVEAVASGSIPALTAPSISSIVNNSTSQLTVTFTDPNSNPNEAYPQVQYDTVNTFDSNPQLATAAQDVTSVIITGLDLVNNQYYVRVRAIGDGVTATNSNWSATSPAPKYPAFVTGSFEVGNVADNIVVLPVDKALDSDSVPAVGDFAVLVDASPNVVTNVDITTNSQQVRLTLTTSVTNGQTVTAAYTKGSNPLQDVDGNEMNSLTATVVTNNVSADTIILMQDEFTGTSIDTGKWTLTEGNANGTVTQNDSLIFTNTSSVASRSNYLDSNTNMPATGAIQVTASNIDDNCSADIKLWDGTQQNEIDILGSAANRTLARLIIRQGDVGQYDLTTSISMNNTFKILRDGDDVSFYYLSAPDTWTQMGTTQTVSGLGTLYPTLQMQARTTPSSSNLDNFYQTNADYSTSTPT